MRKLGITLYKEENEENYYIRKGRCFDDPKDWTIMRFEVSMKVFPW